MLRSAWLILSLAFFWFAPQALADDNPPQQQQQQQPQQTDAEKLAAALRREEELKAELEKERNKNKKKPDDDENDLIAKARREREQQQKGVNDVKHIERAVSFKSGIDEFVKKNERLLPNEVKDIVRAASKESYDTALAYEADVKSSIIQSFFSVKDNFDHLTAAQRATIDDYLKLTKNGKQDKAAEIYENIFEPVLEMARKIKRAEELGRSKEGYLTASSDSEIIFKKVHEKQLRALSSSYELNDVLYNQAKEFGFSNKAKN